MFARKTLLIMGSRITMGLFGFISWYFITNYIFVDYVGSVGFAISYIGLFGLITELGFSSAHIKRVSEGQDLGTCIGTYAAIKIVLLAAFTLLVFGSIWGYRNIYPQRDFANSYDEEVIYIMLAWSILAQLTVVITSTFIGKQQIAKAQVNLWVGALIQAVFTIIIVLNFNDVHILASTWVVGALVTLIMGVFMMRGTRIKPPTWHMIKDYTKFALPLMLVTGIAPIALYLDKLMVKLFWENADVAILWNAQKYAQLPQQISAAVVTVLFPAFSSLVSSGSIKKVRDLTRQAERYISMVMIPLILLLIAMATPFIVLVSDNAYTESGPIFAILLGWVAFRTLQNPYTAHFGSFDKPVYSLYISLLYMPLNLILNILLIPESIYGIPLAGLGGKGAAIATLTAASINYFFVRYLSSRLIKTGVNWRIFRHIVAAGIPACTLYIVQSQWVSLDRWFEISGAMALGLIIYLLLLILFREFTRKEVIFILDTMHPGKMLGYIRDEMKQRT